MTETDRNLRVLLPAKPKDDLGDVSRLLAALFPPAQTQVRRLYVHRPIESDFFIPETYARFSEIARLEFDAENATRFETQHEMKGLAAQGFGVSAEVVRGTPTEESVREASFWRADLVGVRTRSARSKDRKIGGMASALLHHAPCGVLLYREVPEEYRVRRVLIPTDFSRSSRQGFQWGLVLSEVAGAEPYLVHVVADWHDRHGINQGELVSLAAEELDRWRLRASAADPGHPVHAEIVTAGSPAEGILSFAEKKACDLIVVSAVGMSAVRAILLGSNTRKIIRASACPVLVLPSSNRVAAQSFRERARAVPASDPRELVRAATAR